MSTTPSTRPDLARLVVGWVRAGPREPIFDQHWPGSLEQPQHGAALWRLHCPRPVSVIRPDRWVTTPVPVRVYRVSVRTVEQAAVPAAQWQCAEPGQLTGLALSGPRPRELTGLALGFSAYLALRRGADRGAFPVSPTPVGTLGGLWVPHFLAVPTGPATTVRDLVLWELVSPARLHGLFSTNPDAVDFWQRRVGQLCALRAALRTPVLAPQLRRLRAALGSTRYLSFRFVAEQPELVCAALTAAFPEPVPNEENQP